MANVKISDGSSLVSPQLLASTQNTSSEHEQHIRIAGGAGPANETGSLTAAQPTAGSVVAGGTSLGTTDYASVGNVTVGVGGATHLGFTVVFEAQMVSGGDWYTLPAQDEVTNTNIISPAIAQNSVRVFSLSLFGFKFFRIRASTRTSGTLSFVIAPGTVLIEPVVAAVLSNPAGAQSFALYAPTGLALATTSETALAVTPSRNFVAAAAANSHAVTAGKTLRILGWGGTFRLGTAVTTPFPTAILNLRVNPTGAVTTTSPVVNQVVMTPTSTAIGSTASNIVTLGQFLEIPAGAGAQIGITGALITANASATCYPTLYAVEF